ncbi:MAG: SH3 domain-containing protein [Chloroflexi bacterium]|nr:SH3 domain-containing protein [Chloroflexota bacterium]
MKSKLFFTTLVLFFFYSAISAQSYAIRVTFNTNLRADASLQARIVATAPAGTILDVVGALNRWLRVHRDGSEVWMASWVGHTRVEATAPTQPQPARDIDNCCFVDRQCHSDQEWSDGYWAFQNGHCAAPAQTQPQISTEPTITEQVNMPANVDNCCQVNRQCHNDDDWARGFYDYQNGQCAAEAPTTTTPPITGPIPEDVDNCCFVNWQCHSEQDYVSGYERFKYNLCHVPSIEGRIRLDGSGAFRSQVKDALHLLLDKAPKWYNFVISGLHVIRERPGRSASVTARIGVMKVDPNRYPAYDLAAIIVHEACHAHRHKAGLDSGGYQGERDCTTKEVEVLRILAPGSHQLQHEEWLLANMHKTSNQWWHD